MRTEAKTVVVIVEVEVFSPYFDYTGTHLAEAINRSFLAQSLEAESARHECFKVQFGEITAKPFVKVNRKKTLAERIKALEQRAVKAENKLHAALAKFQSETAK